jgi:hypothetical protein
MRMVVVGIAFILCTKVRMDCDSWAMDIHECGEGSGIGIGPEPWHVCYMALAYPHSATAENIAKGCVVRVASAGGYSVVKQTSH